MAINTENTGHHLAGTVLAFDYGEKRIGVAVGNLELGLAHPLATIRNANTTECFANTAQLIEEWKPAMLVVGLPAHADGTEHEMSRRSRRFARRLEGRFGIKTELVDERYTSVDASAALRETGITGKKQKPVLDQMAAQLILQTFFDRRNATT
ncbi:Holliday junction resolvase RuvX [Nitrosospira briensis]|uniref:Putative pre-16S rRNA nuclease n=1 Tax=Nitrosospira briensis TaxID=35799 RepID=A0A1I5C0U7_9PROT|nr:Holliday junction resolvase RuvX [Nitrosospira briensis]SFN80474.1 putative holliday junction resolvase [Nitrosospira briensis]SFO14815.1 putative holliday junction resolvase [Nitrosospira briensis]